MAHVFRGELVGIYVAPVEGEPMEVRGEARLIENVGIDGDRYATSAGKFSRDRRGGRQVTLIEREAVESAAREHDLELDVAETRRNLVTAGVPLNHLVGRDFRIGDVVLRGVRVAEPCAYLEDLVGRDGLRTALVHRGGLRADVVAGGVVRSGDVVEPLG